MFPELSSLIQEFGPAKWCPRQPLNGLIGEGWFLLEITPSPPSGEIAQVVADICNTKPVRIYQGKVYHSNKCGSISHSIPKPIQRAISHIEDEKFLVAVHPGHPAFYNGQPLAVTIEPTINLMVYPDHPHINHGIIRYMKPEIIIPDSICYTDNPSSLGTNQYERLLSAFDEICIWLFRHQVWLATRKIAGRGRWIGPQAPSSLEPKQFAFYINPLGSCRCGNSKLYKDCHMQDDIVASMGCSVNEARRYMYSQVMNWPRLVKNPLNEALTNLKTAVLFTEINERSETHGREQST